MIRPRNPRKIQQGCNPRNLTVIPTASSINNKIRRQRPQPVFPINPVVIDYVPTVIPVKKVVSPNVPFVPPNNPVRNFPKRKRKRNRGRNKRGRNVAAQKSGGSYVWVNSNNVNKVNESENKGSIKNGNDKDATQNVENASENEIITEKVVENNEKLKDIEIVDLTENEENATENEENVTENEENATENEENVTETHVEDNCFEEVEVASSEGDEKQILIGFRKTKLYYLNYKKNIFFKPKIYELSSQRTVVNCLNIGDNASVDVDVDVVSEAEYEYEADNVDQAESEDLLGKILEIEEEPGNEEADQREDEVSMEEVIDNSEKVESPLRRNYKTCIEGEGNDFFQGKSIIQDSIDSWKSHLIGLEYVVEVQSKSKDSVEKYHCVLCECDLSVQGFPIVCVINHISGREHVLKYLDKHFPEFNNSFSEKSELSFFTLQKFCELINQNVGHYFMCITSVDYYSANIEKIKEVIQDASHPCETDMEFNKSDFLQTVDSDLKGEVNSVLDDIIGKVQNKDKCMENDILKDVASKSEEISKTKTKVAPEINDDSEVSILSVKNLVKSEQKKTPSKPLPKYKDNSAVASFLRLGYAAATKFGQPSNKKPPKKAGAISEKKNKSEVEKKSPEVKKKLPEVEKNSSENVEGAPEENDLPKGLLSEDKVDDDLSNLKEAASEGATENIDPDHDVSEEIEVIVIEDNLDENLDEMVPTEETLSSVTESTPSEKSPKSKGKMLVKPTIHSKYCHKRILDSRLRIPTKATGKNQLISGLSTKPKNLPGKKVIVKPLKDVTEKNAEENRHIKTISSSHKKTHSHKISCSHALKSPAVDSAAKHPSFHPKSAHKNTTENSSNENSSVSMTDSLSQWIPMRDLSGPVEKSPPVSDLSLLFDPKTQSFSAKRSVRRHSKSPVRRIKSPLVRRIKSPLKVVRSKSPHRKRSRSPARRKSRTPVRRYSRSPFQQDSRSPRRKMSRSPHRRHSRSPVRKRSRSPVRRHSRSPHRRYSRSPLKRRSRSPVRRRSRSPLRRRSRSPLRKLSRSPLRRRSRSPLRHSRSPLRRRSRSPLRRHSRSPVRRLSRSPLRKYSRSPIKGHLRGSVQKHSRSPIHAESSLYRNLHKVNSPLNRHSSSSRERKSPSLQFSNKDYEFHKYVDSLESELAKMRSKSEMMSSSRSNKSDKFKSSSFPSSSLRGISDLDPVSDEDESIYFGDKHTEDSKTSSSKKLLSKLLQKFSMSDANLNDPALNKLMQFMEAHSNEIEDFIGSQSTSKSSKINETKIDPLFHERALLLQNYLLSNLAGSTLQQGPASFPGLQNAQNFLQKPLQDHFIPGFGLPPPISNMQTQPTPNMQQPMLTPNMQQPPPPTPNMQLPPPTSNIQPQHIVPQPVQPTLNFPLPNFSVPPPNVPPPQLFNQPTNFNQPTSFNQPTKFNQPRPDFSLKRKVPPEMMFKDLKATVNKLFGANESKMKQEKNKLQMPRYVTEPDPEKWDLNKSDNSKYNTLGGSKNVSPQGKNINFGGISDRPSLREEVSLFNRNNNNARNTQEQLYDKSIDRPRIPSVPVPPPDAKVSFCDMPSSSSKGNLFPVVNNPRGNPNYNAPSARGGGGGVSDVKVSLAQRLASVLVKVGMTDVPAPLLQEMLMKIGAFSSSPRQDISESEILTILKRLGYL